MKPSVTRLRASHIAKLPMSANPREPNLDGVEHILDTNIEQAGG
jgi:hypothetical protein